MFLENDYAEPLFSLSGGPPKAFRCLTCGEICKTEGGMKQHLTMKHNWKEQPCLYSTEIQSAQKSNESKKSKRKRSRNQEKQDVVSIEKNETLKSAVTNEGELLRLMKEES
jgi:hypothetical protein